MTASAAVITGSQARVQARSNGRLRSVDPWRSRRYRRSTPPSSAKNDSSWSSTSSTSGRLRASLASAPRRYDGSRGFDTQMTSASMRWATSSMVAMCDGKARPSNTLIGISESRSGAHTSSP